MKNFIYLFIVCLLKVSEGAGSSSFVELSISQACIMFFNYYFEMHEIILLLSYRLDEEILLECSN